MTDFKISNTAPQYAMAVVPVMGTIVTAQSNVVTASNGALKSNLTSNSARQVTFSNNSGTTVEVFQDTGTVGFAIYDQTYYTLYGLSNTNQLSVRRVDQSNTQVSVSYRMEG